jgi:Flp pilus assembly protein TadG
MSQNFLSGFGKDRRGSVILIYALSLPVLALAVGFAIDFGRAAQLRTRLNGAADAAALAALTPAMMAQSNATAKAAAISMFNGQASGLNGLASSDTTVNVTVTHPKNNRLVRNVSVCYSAAEQTIFAGILNGATFSLGNCVSATAQTPPNVDFYLLLDNSPSMSLPQTQDGIVAMNSATQAQEVGGCAFACHEASTNNWDTWGNPCADGHLPTASGGLSCAPNQGAQLDNYALAKKLGVKLRLDELTAAVSTLLSTAQTTTNSSPHNPPPAYRFSIDSFDSLWQPGFTTLMPLTSNYVSGWTSASANFGVMEMYKNNYVCATSACASGVRVDDAETDFDNAMSSVNAQMAAPGNGSNQAGDTPQEVLFLVTDGVEDEDSSGIRLIQPINAGSSTNYCDVIKARGIKIAILYTDYLPVPASSYYQQSVASFQSDIGPALQSCASPNLFFEAAIDADLSQALSQLFQNVVMSANLTQ